MFLTIHTLHQIAIDIQMGPTPKGSVPSSFEDRPAGDCGSARAVGGVVTLHNDVAAELSESGSDESTDVTRWDVAEMLSQGFSSHEEGSIHSDAQGFVPTAKDENDEVT